MKLPDAIGFSATDIIIRPLKARWYEVVKDVLILIHLDDGTTIKLHIKAGFKFDGRSGGWIFDLLLPNLGNQRYCACVLVHDALCHEIGISYPMTNWLFKGMLIHAPVAKWRGKGAYKGISTGDWYFGAKTPQEVQNSTLCYVEWTPQSSHLGR